MTVALKRKRETQPTFSEVVAGYPGMPRLIALKIDVQRRGVHYTERALSVVDDSVQMRSPYIFGSRDGEIKPLPESLILRDGTTILTDPTPLEQHPYLVDLVDGRPTLVDDGEPLEFVEFWPKPRYYEKKTRSGIPMSHIVSARPQRLNIFQSNFCQFWANKQECRFCDIVNHTRQQKDALGVPSRLKPEDVSETISEALKEPGRFTGMCLTAGSVLKGETIFDREVDYYIETLQAIGENFKTRKFPSQLIASAFNDRQLTRIYEETGLTSYTSDLEVLDERLFNWICPGKAQSVGYREWQQRLIRAVDIFGRGNVGTGLVGGVELAKPNGFTSEAEALESTLAEAEYLAEHGVTTVFIVWVPRPGSNFRNQQNPSLDYYLRLSMGLHSLRVKYNLRVDFDDYRRCGNHPDTDLSRLLQGDTPSPQPQSPGEGGMKSMVRAKKEKNMAAHLTTEIIDLLKDKETTKVLATLDADGFPHAVVKQSLQPGEDGSIIHLELLESSRTNKNLVRSLWFNQKVAISLKGKDGRSYQIKGTPIKAHITGPLFQEHYTAVREKLGDVNLAAVWVIEPEEIIDETFATRKAEEEAAHPFFSHLDRIARP